MRTGYIKIIVCNAIPPSAKSTKQPSTFTILTSSPLRPELSSIKSCSRPYSQPVMQPTGQTGRMMPQHGIIGQGIRHHRLNLLGNVLDDPAAPSLTMLQWSVAVGTALQSVHALFIDLGRLSPVFTRMAGLGTGAFWPFGGVGLG